jgi:hypothetical protein
MTTSKGCKQTYSTRLSVTDFNFEGKRKIDHNPHRLGFCFILVTELKQEMFDPETKGCIWKTEDMSVSVHI